MNKAHTQQSQHETLPRDKNKQTNKLTWPGPWLCKRLYGLFSFVSWVHSSRVVLGDPAFGILLVPLDIKGSKSILILVVISCLSLFLQSRLTKAILPNVRVSFCMSYVVSKKRVSFCVYVVFIMIRNWELSPVYFLCVCAHFDLLRILMTNI